MMRFCPNCQTERALTEIFCEGRVGDRPCGWDLSAEPIHAAGWRPVPVISAQDLALPDEEEIQGADDAAPRCVNGHPMDAGDLICLVCGADMAPEDEVQDEPAAITDIDGWRILRRINRNDSVRERYLAQQRDGGRRAVLTLYAGGAEPDPAIYDVVRRLPREHVPEIIATGRWNERAWQVAEELTGGSLDAFVAGGDFWREDEIPHVVRELGQALACLAEHGLRHRDLRPGNLLIRTRDPLDIVIIEFGSACLSEFDLDIVAPLEISRYSAPETLAGGVAAASDWWSLGIILLEQLTRGACFEEIHPHAFLIQVLANGVTIPDTLAPRLQQLLRGLLTRDRQRRWQWPEVEAWLAGRPVAVSADAVQDGSGRYVAITLEGRSYSQPAAFALAAAEVRHWQAAQELLTRGAVTTWAQEIGLAAGLVETLRQVSESTELDADYRLMLALKLLNPHMPLIYRGEIVTPAWLLEHPQQGYALLSGPLPDLLAGAESGHWLSQLKNRQEKVRLRGAALKVRFDEETLRIHLLAASRARLAAIWQEQRRLFPDTAHPGLRTLIDRRNPAEEELIVLLSADITQFIPAESLLNDAAALAERLGVLAFEREAARAWLASARQEIYQQLAVRIDNFNRCDIAEVDAWAEQFLLTRRLPLEQALVMLAIPPEQWLVPEKRRYVSQVLNFFTRKISASSSRGALVRMRITPHAGRVDLLELDGEGRRAQELLNHLLARIKPALAVDGRALLDNEQANDRLRTLNAQAQLYQRDTGIDGLYLGFPFLLINTQPKLIKPRIAPLLLWPVSINMEAGIRGVASLRFDHERGAVRLNPALENFVGIPALKRWQSAADALLSQASLNAEEVMDGLSALLPARERQLVKLPSADEDIAENSAQLACCAVLFHASFIGQAISEDLRQLSALPPGETSLATALGLHVSKAFPLVADDPTECYFAAASDPSQESAILAARRAPGLLIEGPPGTGKSQTIVNMVADAIGRQRSLLVICQKPAALEVVFKRLQACGLGDRIVMVKDALKSRDAIIRNVRAQLENLYQPVQTDEAVNPWVASRADAAGRLENSGRVLDDYYQALYRTDARIGLSYRQILADLVALDDEPNRLDAAALRPLLQPLTAARTEEIARSVVPWAGLWLDADYEHSPLSQLAPFPADAASLTAFETRFVRLCAAERNRDATLADPARVFVVMPDELDEQRQILMRCMSAFADLTMPEWDDLSRWLPQFRAWRDNPPQGAQILQQLAQLDERLSEVNEAPADPLMFNALAACDSGLLAQLIAGASAALSPGRRWRYLNPLFYLRRSRMRAFVQRQGWSADNATLTRLWHSACAERQWRLVRTELSRLYQRLGEAPPETSDGLALADCLAMVRRRLRYVADLSALLPPTTRWVEAVIERRQAGFARLCVETEAALRHTEARTASHDALTALQAWFETVTMTAFSGAIEQDMPLTPTLMTLHDALPSLAAYQRFRLVATGLDADCLSALAILRAQAQRLKACAPADLATLIANTLKREARLAWKQDLEQQVPSLILARRQMAEEIERLDMAEREMRVWNRLALTAIQDRTRIRPLRDWEEITRLRGKRARRLREFIEEGEALGLMQLRPVWLMTPDVASQVLPLKPGLFDTVIYDEASQMPVEYALPTLYRSRQVVVSGDEKQMPPSSFFSGKFAADDDDDERENEDEQQESAEEEWDYRRIGDCPDLLHLARTVLPVQTLEIHYRSIYRELIDFSNHAFYENRLQIPAQHSDKAVADAQPVTLIALDGLYQNQTNPQEAQRVVELLAQLWQRPRATRPSVGTVTFNQKQAQLIQNLLEVRAEQDEAFRLAYHEEQARSEEDEDMSCFVKNVENVQGDERDVIIFSTTFGRNKQGTFRRNFGVLGQNGGERRLNVAVTRARKQVMIVSSMPIDEISDLLAIRRQPDIPRDFLQGYLEYARRLSQREFSQTQALLQRMTRTQSAANLPVCQTDGFVDAVMTFISELGWRVVASRQEGAFYFDCLVEDPHSGAYLIGIECDMPHHPLLRQARARELWRPALLKRVAPYRHRVSIQRWFDDGQQERLLLQQALASAWQATRQSPSETEIMSEASQ